MTDSNINIQMLKNVITIIDVVTRRGAFKAEELSVVGSTYTYVKKYIESLESTDTETETESKISLGRE